MTGKDKQDEADQPVDDCASPPCLMHEVDPAYVGLDGGPKAESGKECDRREEPETRSEGAKHSGNAANPQKK
jgi:hypothetical protein